MPKFNYQKYFANLPIDKKLKALEKMEKRVLHRVQVLAPVFATKHKQIDEVINRSPSEIKASFDNYKMQVAASGQLGKMSAISLEKYREVSSPESVADYADLLAKQRIDVMRDTLLKYGTENDIEKFEEILSKHRATSIIEFTKSNDFVMITQSGADSGGKLNIFIQEDEENLSPVMRRMVDYFEYHETRHKKFGTYVPRKKR